jgi:hypothetical protein
MSFIFVTGNSRSGTKMMGRILSNHQRVHSFPEMHFFEQLWSGSDRKKTLSKEEALKLAALLLNISREGYFAKRHPEDFTADAAAILDPDSSGALTGTDVFSRVLLAESRRNGKEIPCDQTPQNVFYIREILEVFPDSNILSMVRDPRDVLLSQKRKWKRRFLGGAHATWFETIRAWTNYHPLTISKLWNAAIHARETVKDKRVMSVKFEELLKDPDRIIEGICYFLGIPFSAEMKQVPQVGSSSGLDKADTKGINADRAQSWGKGGLNATEIWFCQRTCRSYMQQLGYEEVPVTPNPFSVVFYYLIFPFKLGLAFLLNLHRMKNIGETILKRLGR